MNTRKRVEFTVPGVPVGKGRPKFSTRNGYARAYTPEKTAAYENLVRSCYTSKKTLEGAVKAHITAVFPIPKSTSKKLRQVMEAGKMCHTKKPDADNVAKAVLDALNGIAYKDDSSVAVLNVVKLYGAEPHVRVVLEELGS